MFAIAFTPTLGGNASSVAPVVLHLVPPTRSQLDGIIKARGLDGLAEALRPLILKVDGLDLELALTVPGLVKETFDFAAERLGGLGLDSGND